jgi:hypothetical protein
MGFLRPLSFHQATRLPCEKFSQCALARMSKRRPWKDTRLLVVG